MNLVPLKKIHHLNYIFLSIFGGLRIKELLVSKIDDLIKLDSCLKIQKKSRIKEIKINENTNVRNANFVGIYSAS